MGRIDLYQTPWGAALLERDLTSPLQEEVQNPGRCIQGEEITGPTTEWENQAQKTRPRNQVHRERHDGLRDVSASLEV